MKITFYGHFGTLNTGNESTLLAIVSRLRAHSPDCEIACVCSNPESLTAAQGLDAIAISTRSARIWNRDAALGERLRTAIGGARQEFGQYVRAVRALRGTDALIIPGTGLLTDAYGMVPWGPYNTFKWTLAARLRGCKVLVVSVGAGPVDSVLGRVLVKATLRLASYRSYRDEASRSHLRNIGLRTGRDPIYPDLVFGLPDALIPVDVDAGTRRPVVGIGLMWYVGNYSIAHSERATYAAYLRSLGVFARWLLEHDYDIRLLVGDGDAFVIQDFKALLQAEGVYDARRVVDQPITSIQEVLHELAATDVVVATRFHNVLLALLLNKPVMAISFHHKCSSLMTEMQLSEYCHDINRLDVDALVEQFEKLQSNTQSVRRIIREGVERAREALEEQYDLIFNGLGSGRSPVR